MDEIASRKAAQKNGGTQTMNRPECTGCGVEHRKDCPASIPSLAQQGLRILIAAGCVKSGVAASDAGKEKSSRP